VGFSRNDCFDSKENVNLRVFVDPRRDVAALSWAMYQLDEMIVNCDSVSPEAHGHYYYDQHHEGETYARVKKLFSSGHAIWHRKLIALRNRWLIATRAVLTGKDPIDEISQFEDAGMTYYLDYPQLYC